VLVQLEQRRLDPERTLIAPGGGHMRDYDIGLAHIPSACLGGDLCERVPHANGSNSVLMADVAGDGAAATAAASFIQGLFVAAAASQRSVAGLVAQLNAEICVRLGPRQPAALWAAQFGRNGELAFCSAGHAAPFLVPGDGSPVRRLEGSGPLAGVSTPAPYEEDRLRLLPGDLVAVLSDGVLDARDAALRSFGAERAAELLDGIRHQPLDALCDQVCAASLQFAGRPAPSDDLTVLAVRYAPGG
jgi:sigma-B regulation protein RsbU (phosphoserine phosphatase)